MIKQSLVIRVLVTSFIFVAFPLLIYFIIFFYNEYEHSLNHTYETLLEASKYRNFVLEETQPIGTTFLGELDYFLSISNELKNLPNKEFNEKLTRLTSYNRKFDIIILGKEEEDNYYPILSSDYPEDIGTDFFSINNINLIGVKGKDHFLRFVYSEKEHRTIPFIYSGIALPQDHPTNPAGYLLIRTNVEEQINQLLTKTKEEGHDIYYAIVHHRGYIEAATDPDLVGERFKEISPQEQNIVLHVTSRYDIPFFKPQILPSKKIGNNPNSPFFEFKWKDETQLGAMNPYKNRDIGFSFLAYTSKKGILLSSIAQFAFINAIFGLILVGGSIFAYWLAKWISRPLTQLINLMKEVRGGKLNHRFQKAPFGFEINLLGESFNNTLDSLLENMQKAEDERVKKETLQKEIDIGKKVQHGLLPSKMPLVEGIELAATYITSEEVGGDFYDISLVEERLYLVCADASGRGISSCLYSLGVRSLLRTYSTLYKDVGTILTMTNNAFCEDTGDSGMFISCQLGSLDLKTKILEYHACGQVPAIIRKKDGTLIYLTKKSLPLGFQIPEKIVPSITQLESGDIVIFYTDGLINITNEKNEKFTAQDLDHLLKTKSWDTATDVALGLKHEITLFLQNSFPFEEIPILAVKVL